MARQGRVGMSLWDRLVLLVAWVLTCGLVYVLGIYVGKGTQERRFGIADRVVRLPVASTPPAEGQRPKGESELRFYDTLMPGTASEVRPDGRAAKMSPPAPQPRAPRPPATVAKPALTTAPGATAPPVTAPAAAPPAAAARPAPKLPADIPPRTVRPEAGVPKGATTDIAAPVPALGRTPPGIPPRAATTPPEARPPSLARPGGWTVQANPTRSREEAEGLSRQLRGRGYEASIVRVLRDGDTWYRVQIGQFATSEQATEIMQKLREREGVSHAFVASE